MNTVVALRLRCKVEKAMLGSSAPYSTSERETSTQHRRSSQQKQPHFPFFAMFFNHLHFFTSSEQVYDLSSNAIRAYTSMLTKVTPKSALVFCLIQLAKAHLRYCNRHDCIAR